MKIGYINLLSDATFSGGSNPTYARGNDSLKVTTLAAAATLTITLSSAKTLEFISIFNYDGTNLEVKVNRTGPVTDTENLTTADATGFGYNNYYVATNQASTVISITLKNTGLSSANIGYVWAGAWIDFGCAENIQFFDESTDNVTVDRTNRPLYDAGYKFQSVNVTTKKETTFSTLKTNVRKILNTGYALSRPFLFDDQIVTNELMLGILASGRVGYDTFLTSSNAETLSQISIEIREVV